MIANVPIKDLHRVWPDLWPLLEPAALSSADKPDVLAEIMARRADLWAIYEYGKPVAAVVTTKQENGRCLVWLIGGSRVREWAGEFMKVLIPAAVANGCTSIWGCGRRGWDRIVPALGLRRIEDHDGRPAWGMEIAA